MGKLSRGSRENIAAFIRLIEWKISIRRFFYVAINDGAISCGIIGKMLSVNDDGRRHKHFSNDNSMSDDKTPLYLT